MTRTGKRRYPAAFDLLAKHPDPEQNIYAELVVSQIALNLLTRTSRSTTRPLRANPLLRAYLLPKSSPMHQSAYRRLRLLLPLEQNDQLQAAARLYGPTTPRLLQNHQKIKNWQSFL